MPRWIYAILDIPYIWAIQRFIVLKMIQRAKVIY